MTLRQIAFLGLGIMGAPMAAHLSRAGHRVLAWNRTPGRTGITTAARGGAEIAGSCYEAVSGADVVFLCLSDVADLEAVLSDERLLTASKPHALFVDMSTTGPQCARRVSASLSQRGLRFLDAPVSGGDVGAANATLTIMVGGERGDFDECLPLLQCLGKTIRYCGVAGSGQAVKLCNQILCAVNLIGVCEALSLSEELGIDPSLVVDICSTGAAGSWSLTNLGAKILKSDFAPGFKIKDMRKDLRLIGEAAGDIQQRLPGAALADANFALSERLAESQGIYQGTQAMMNAYRGMMLSGE